MQSCRRSPTCLLPKLGTPLLEPTLPSLPWELTPPGHALRETGGVRGGRGAGAEPFSRQGSPGARELCVQGDLPAGAYRRREACSYRVLGRHAAGRPLIALCPPLTSDLSMPGGATGCTWTGQGHTLCVWLPLLLFCRRTPMSCSAHSWSLPTRASRRQHSPSSATTPPPSFLPPALASLTTHCQAGACRQARWCTRGLPKQPGHGVCVGGGQ